MKFIKSFLLTISIVMISGCSMDNRMVLLEEEVVAVEVSESLGSGEMNDDIIYSFSDQSSIQIFEEAIKSAKKGKTDVDLTQPDYDIFVEYKDGLPTHAIHLWIGEEGEKSTMIYMVDYLSGEAETYQTSATYTKQLRSLLDLSK